MKYTRAQLLAMPAVRIHVTKVPALMTASEWEDVYNYREEVNGLYTYDEKNPLKVGGYEIGTDGKNRYIEVYDEELDQT